MSREASGQSVTWPTLHLEETISLSDFTEITETDSLGRGPGGAPNRSTHYSTDSTPTTRLSLGRGNIQQTRPWKRGKSQRPK